MLLSWLKIFRFPIAFKIHLQPLCSSSQLRLHLLLKLLFSTAKTFQPHSNGDFWGGVCSSISFDTCMDSRDHHHCQDTEWFHHPQNLPRGYPFTVISNPIACPWQPRIYSSPYRSVFSITSCKYNTTYWDWLHSLSTMPLRVTQVVVCHKCVPFYCWGVFHCPKIPRFAHSFTRWGTFWLFPVWGNYK